MIARPSEADSSLVFGTEKILDIIAQTVENSQTEFNICVDALTSIFAIRFSRIRDSLLDAVNARNIKVRLITEIAQENSEICKELSKAGLEVRHGDRIRASFGTNGIEYFSFYSIQEGTSPSELIYSNSKEIVRHFESAFQALWDSSIPLQERISQIRHLPAGTPQTLGDTRVIKGIEQVGMFIVSFLERVKAVDYNLPFVYAVADKNSPNLLSNLDWMIEETVQAHPDFEGKLITDVQKENLEYIEKLLQIGIKVRHIEGIKGRFAFSKDEHIETSGNLVSGLPDEIVWSNSPAIIAKSEQIFQALWETGLPAESRIKQIEEGREQSISKIVRGNQEVTKAIEDLIRQGSQSVSIVFGQKEVTPSTNRILDCLVETLERKAMRVRILAPEAVLHHRDKLTQSNVEWQAVDETFLDLVIVDEMKGVILSRSVASERTGPPGRYELGLISTDQATVRSFVSIFNTLFRESVLRRNEILARQDALRAMEVEARTRRQIELLQDIVTHDMRNHNQVTLLSAELLLEELDSKTKPLQPDSLKSLAKSIVSSIDRANDLIDRAKSFGRMLSQQGQALAPVSFVNSLNRSIEVLKRANPSKEIVLRIETFPPSLSLGSVMVEGDELFDQVLLNILSNSIKYTNRPEVPIEICIEDLPEEKRWKITISDRGPGVPETFRNIKAFNRYLSGAKGSGLGLSIVHTLIVEHYRGEFRIGPREDRVTGTVAELVMAKWENAQGNERGDHLSKGQQESELGTQLRS